WWQAPTILNAHLSSGTKDFDASRVVYEPLAAFNPDGEFAPILAEEIPTLENNGLSRDGKSVTWKLKKGVVWHDGKPLTADDVVFTWEYVADPATAATTSGSYTNIDRIEKLNDHSVKVFFKEPNPFWYDAFFGGRGHILPKHLLTPYKGQESRNAPYNLKPVGTGPYKIVEFKPGDVVRYEINMQYHVPNRPFFDTVELKGGGDATSAARAVMQTGEFDFAWNMQVEKDILEQLERQGGKGKVSINPGASVEHIQINWTDPWKEVDGERASIKVPHPFLTDLKVRQAYAAAVDRKLVADELYGAAGQPSSNWLNSPARFRSPNTTWEFDPKKAAQLLDEAGWKRGPDGIRVKDGRKMKLVYQTSINPVRQKTQQIIKKTFESIGVEVEIKAVDAGVYFASDPGNPDTYSHFYTDIQMYTTGPGAPDPQAWMEQFTSWQFSQKANNWAGRNITRWSNPEYDKLWNQAKGEMDPVKRAALFIQMNDMVINDVAVIPIVWRNGVSCASTKIKGMNLTTWDSNLWRLAYWHREA
ncbi:MAG: peptide ABC transporter substrate-binding protein, partial [Candidatus Tectomicrobia bacterium]|nr:peptide ABC transporter substrate-binding protein [Candidatus Tectomicrobia bacterium]